MGHPRRAGAPPTHPRRCRRRCAAIAVGRLDGFYERGLSPWDHAAGALIVREAGGVVGGVGVGGAGGAVESSELLVAAPPSVYDELLALVVEAGAATG